MSISPIDEHDDRPPVPRRNHDAIHLAPCSCELHVRIRELEQTLEEGLDYLRIREQELVIVTERNRELEAELEKEQLANRILRSPIYEGAAAGSIELAQRAVEAAERAKARAEKAERTVQELNRSLDERQARVAELEAEIERWEKGSGIFQARERVGDETPSQGVHEREEC